MGGCWDTENESPNNCWRCSRHAAVCYQTRESPSSGKCSIFCYRLTYISKMCSMHTKHFCWDGIAVIVIGSYSLFATGVPILPWMGPHVSYNSTWQLSSSARLQWQHVIIGQRTLTWWYMDVCKNVYSTTVAPSPLVQNIHPFQLPGCDVSILTNWPPSSHSQLQVVVSSESKLHWILITPLLTDKICNEQTNLHHLSDWWNQTISMNHEMR